MSIKRIIELEEVKVNGQKYYKAVGCNTLFFDKNGFKNITKPLEEKKSQKLNCKFCVVCQSGFLVDEGLTVGKIYEVEDGRFRANDGYLFPLSCDSELHTVDELREYLGPSGKFCGTDAYEICVLVE